MKLKAEISYYKSFIPYRCRKPRYEEITEIVNINLKEAKKEELVLKYSYNYVEHIDLYLYKNQLYRKAKISDVRCNCSEDEYSTILDAIKHWNYFYAREYESKENVIKRAKEHISRYLLVDNDIYIKDSKPLYHICTFGLGNNHGGTGWMITASKYSAKQLNRQYRIKCYFEPEEYEESYKHALETANGRGDTEDVIRFKKYYKTDEHRIKIY